MSRTLVFLLTIGCATQPQTLPVDQAAAFPGYTIAANQMSMDGAARGSTLEIEVNLPLPPAPRQGVFVRFYQSDGPTGPAGSGACPPALLGTCLDIDGATQALGTDEAIDGVATVTYTTPIDHPGPVVSFQGAVVTPSGAVYLTDPISMDVVDSPAGQIAALQAQNAAMLATLTDLVDQVADLQGDLADAQTDIINTQAEIDTLPLGSSNMLAASTTWNVPADYPTLAAALGAAGRVIIPTDVLLTIQIADGTYTSTTPVEFRHPQGNRIRILGNPADPTAVVLEWQNSHGLQLKRFVSLGYIDGVTLRGNHSAGSNGIYNGVAAGYNSHITLGSNVIVEDWSGTAVTVSGSSSVLAAGNAVIPGPEFNDNGYRGVVAVGSSYAFVSHSSADNNGETAYLSTYNSSVLADGATADGNTVGFLAQRAGSISAANASASNGEVGFSAEHLAVMNAREATASGHINGGLGSGFVALRGSFMFAYDANAINNDIGLRAFSNSYLQAPLATLTGNGTDASPDVNVAGMSNEAFIEN